MAEEERGSVVSTTAASYHTSPPTSDAWNPAPHIYPHSHHGTPAQEYAGFNFHQSPPLPMESNSFGTIFPQRSMPQQLQPLVMPQWPSMLSSQNHPAYQPVYHHQHHHSPPLPQQHQPPQHHRQQHQQQAPSSSPPLHIHPVQPIQPIGVPTIPTPISAVSSRSGSTPRKTLTDLDRKKMCLYADQHPDSKQTEIGAIFGVERSTVSKVLRQKEKYLSHEDGSRSPIKRIKGRTPDVDKTLAKWALKQERQGFTLTDELIREKARYFAKATTTPDGQLMLSATWLEKFKFKNGLMGARNRKASFQTDDGDTGAHLSLARTNVDTSPTSSPQGLQSPSDNVLQTIQQHETIKHESPDSYVGFRHPFHSASSTSISTAFTDTAPSSTFSPGPLSPTSPFFTPDSGTAPSPFFGLPSSRPPTTLLPPSSAITHTAMSTAPIRPRSQTFPLLDAFMVSTGDSLTPVTNSGDNAALDSPMEESADPSNRNDDEYMGNHSDNSLSTIAHPMASTGMPSAEDRCFTISPSQTMRPPPLPAHITEHSVTMSSAYDNTLTSTTRAAMITSSPQPVLANHLNNGTSISQSPTPAEACRALEVVMNFLEHQASGYVGFQETISMGKLMEKLKLQSKQGLDIEQQ